MFLMQIFPMFLSWKRSFVLHRYACWNWLFMFLKLFTLLIQSFCVYITVSQWISCAWYSSGKIGSRYNRISSSFCCYWGHPWTGILSVIMVYKIRLFAILTDQIYYCNITGGYQSNFWERRSHKKLFLFWCFWWEGYHRRHIWFKYWKVTSLGSVSFSESLEILIVNMETSYATKKTSKFQSTDWYIFAVLTYL